MNFKTKILVEYFQHNFYKKHFHIFNILDATILYEGDFNEIPNFSPRYKIVDIQVKDTSVIILVMIRKKKNEVLKHDN